VTDPTVLLTRPEGRDEPLARRLRDRGFRVLLAPAIRFEPVPVEVDGSRYDWLVVTSRTAARHLPAGSERAPRVAAIGRATAEELARIGRAADLVASVPTGVGLATELIAAGKRGAGTRVLHPTSDRPRPELREALEAAGWTVEPVTAYRTLAAESLPGDVVAELEAGRVAATVFASPSTVEALVGLLPPAAAGHLRASAAVAIGETTAGALREAGFERVATSPAPDPDALAARIEDAIRKEPS
jgi:uroporphyrinogen-III synthase